MCASCDANLCMMPCDAEARCSMSCTCTCTGTAVYLPALPAPPVLTIHRSIAIEDAEVMMHMETVMEHASRVMTGGT